ncbi:DUF397 domain-containing protein [Streptomyces sp. SID3343]|nr:DUF397 domain-containing protein [Streptomyces sp. SID3343]
MPEAAWFTSSYTSSDTGQCVEVALPGTVAGVRDTKRREQGHIRVPTRSWQRLLLHVKQG